MDGDGDASMVVASKPRTAAVEVPSDAAWLVAATLEGVDGVTVDVL